MNIAVYYVLSYPRTWVTGWVYIHDDVLYIV